MEQSGAPVLTDGVLEALRSSYDTRGDMSDGGARQSACVGGQRWRPVCVEPKESHKRLHLSPSSLRRQQRKYAVPQEDGHEHEYEHEQHYTVPGQGALHWNPPSNASDQRVANSQSAPVIQAGRRRGMLQKQARAVRLDFAIEDVYKKARQNLADQRATVLQLTAMTSAQQSEERVRAKSVCEREAAAARVAQTAHANYTQVYSKDRANAHRTTGVTDTGAARNFLKGVKRSYDGHQNRVARFPGGSAKKHVRPTAQLHGQQLSLYPQQCEQLEAVQRQNEQLRNAPELAAAVVKRSHKAKPSTSRSNHGVLPITTPTNQSTGTVEWSVTGWSVAKTPDS